MYWAPPLPGPVAGNSWTARPYSCLTTPSASATTSTTGTQPGSPAGRRGSRASSGCTAIRPSVPRARVSPPGAAVALEPGLDAPVRPALDQVRGLVRLLGQRLDELGAAVVQAHPVVGRVRRSAASRRRSATGTAGGAAPRSRSARRWRTAPARARWSSAAGPDRTSRSVPPTCQQIEPAETPVSTTPACQASRIRSSTRAAATSPAARRRCRPTPR